MKRKAAFFIALRYLWGRAREGGQYLRGAAAGIAISLVPIIVTLIVADGMIRGITDRYLELGTGHFQIFKLYNSGNDESAIAAIKSFDRVKGVWPEMRSMGVLAGKDGKTGVTVRSIDASFWDFKSSVSFLNVIDGERAPKTERDIILGQSLASNIGAYVGDTVRLMTIRTGQSGRPSPRSAAFVVKGIISCGYNELDALWCIINTEGGNRIMSAEHSSSSILVKIDDPYRNNDDLVLSLYDALDSGYTVYTWKDLLRSQYSSYESTRQMLLFIMALIVIVAAINVSSATSMLVLERQRDIAILKVSGGSVKGITGIFLWGSFFTGFFGSIIGITLGLLIGININILIRLTESILSFFSRLFRGSDVKILDPGFYLETIPVVVDWNAVLIIGCFAILCSVLASWIPAHSAGKLKPMELLRKN
ncbi:MAG: ABC transporter permease [Treponema sp.]|nr:ABC transporter permease [Treponema sp.]